MEDNEYKQVMFLSEHLLPILLKESTDYRHPNKKHLMALNELLKHSIGRVRFLQR